MGDIPYYRSRLRVKGQITVPGEIRDILGVEEGDELVFRIDENGRVIVERVLVIPPDQAWFWSERWQRMEHEVQEDIRKNRIQQFDSTEDVIKKLHQAAGDPNAKDTTD